MQAKLVRYVCCLVNLVLIQSHFTWFPDCLALASNILPRSASPRPRQCCLGLVKTSSPTSLILLLGLQTLQLYERCLA